MLHLKVTTLIFILLQTNLAISACLNNISACLNNGNYTTDSPYAANLISLLSSLPESIDDNGFRNASVGSQDPDRANAIALCRADIQLPLCRQCIHNLTAALRGECPNQRQAVLWSEFCTLRYSNETIIGSLATSPNAIYPNPLNATNQGQFMMDVNLLLDRLRGQAAGGGSLRKVAVGNVTGPDFQHIYGMVQCTPDLSHDDCSRCLIEAARVIPGCYNGRIGLGVNSPSCNLRYENSSFYNETRLQELAALPPGPAPEPPSPRAPSQSPPPPSGIAGTNDGSNTTRNVFTIVVSIAACAILTFLVL